MRIKNIIDQVAKFDPSQFNKVDKLTYRIYFTFT